MVLPSSLITNLFLFVVLGASMSFLFFSVVGQRRLEGVNLFESRAWHFLLFWPLAVVFVVALILHTWFHQVVWMDSEVGVHAVAASALFGLPYYHRFDAPYAYALLYGPLTYLPFSTAFELFGISQLTAKMTGIVGFFVGCGMMWFSVRAPFENRESKGLFLVIAALLLVPFGSFSYYPKAEPLLLVLAAAPFVTRSPRWMFGLATACALVAVFVKWTAVVYFIPPLVLAFFDMKRGRLVALLVSIGMALSVAAFAVAFLPVGLFVEWQLLASKHPLKLANFFNNLGYAAPIIFIGWLLVKASPNALPVRTKIFMSSILLSVAGLCLVGSKVGAGAYHLFPLAPAGLLLFRELVERRGKLPSSSLHSHFAIGLSFTVIVITGVYALYIANSFARNAETVGVRDEILAAASQLQCDSTERKRRGLSANDRCASLAMGYGRHKSRASNHALDVVSVGGTIPITDISLWDSVAFGAGFPQALTDSMSSCAVQGWLIPAGDKPFVTEGLYDNSIYLFPEDFVTVFRDRYQLRVSGKHFDLWTCKKGVGR